MPAARRHKVVAVDNWVQAPQLAFDHDFTQYEHTFADEYSEHVKDATIVITSGTPWSRAAIESAPNLELISCNGVGTDHIDKDAVRERGITVCNVPAQNKDSVSEHAFALYYAIRRHIVDMHAVTINGQAWKGKPQLAYSMGYPPRTNAEETLVVVGYGSIGRNVERLGKALDMNVLIAERKGATKIREGRTAFEDAIKQGTVFIVNTPLDQDTRDMISTPEFEAMDKTALTINVGRGGVINEAALAKALKAGQIAGAATDVFETEPATKENCPLLDDSIPNLVLSPHIAWYSSRTIKGTVAMVKVNIEGYVAGKPQNIIVEGRGCQ